ncbi:MAG: hypothetical protein C0518_09250 [Opitutus sp.]|nr:hypothetical protein [Opitutus sp.]
MLAILTSHPIQYQAPLWRALAEAGVKFEVWFLTPHAVEASFDREFGRSFAWDVDLLEGYPHRFLPIGEGWSMNEFNGVRLTARWRDEFAARGVTHLWVEGWRFREFWNAVRAAHAGGLQVWLRGENNDLVPRGGVRDLARRLALRWLFARIDRFLCIGTSNRRFYQALGVPEAKLASAPYGVDNERFARAAAELQPRRAELRARWNIASAAFVLLFCGKLIAKKRPLDLVAAAQLAAADTARPLHLLFAGDGEFADAVRAALVERRVTGTVIGFLNQSEVPAAYAAADCLVLPSEAWETWGLVVNEALASGLDVLVSDRCGCAEDLARPLGPDHVFPGGDTLALAHAIVRCEHQPSAIATRRAIVSAHAPQRTVETVRALLSRA